MFSLIILFLKFKILIIIIVTGHAGFLTETLTKSNIKSENPYFQFLKFPNETQM